MKIEDVFAMVSLERTAETSFAKKICELRSCAGGDEASELLPSMLTIRQGKFEYLYDIVSD